LQYQNRRADYVDAIWNLVDWRDVAARFDRARDVVLIEH
jgi:Fe-Mn family superoxide dismutase